MRGGGGEDLQPSCLSMKSLRNRSWWTSLNVHFKAPGWLRSPISEAPSRCAVLSGHPSVAMHFLPRRLGGTSGLSDTPGLSQGWFPNPVPLLRLIVRWSRRFGNLAEETGSSAAYRQFSLRHMGKRQTPRFRGSRRLPWLALPAVRYPTRPGES